MDSQNDNFPFLPSVLFPSKLHKPRPTSTKCLSLGNTVMWSILWGWNKMQGVLCTACKMSAITLHVFLQHLYLTSGILATQHMLTVIDFRCQRVSVTNSHMNKTATWLHKEHIRTTLVGEMLTVPRTMLKLLIHGNKFSRFSTAFTKHPTTAVQNAAMWPLKKCVTETLKYRQPVTWE